MKLYTFLLILIFISCKENEVKSDNKISDIEIKEKEHDFSGSMKFKYENITSVEVYSFLNKTTVEMFKGYRKDINFNSDVQISNDFIKENIKLNDRQKLELFNLITKDSCKSEQSPSECYNPRHAIFFKDKVNKTLGSIEMCLDCDDFNHSESLGNAKYYCYDDMRMFLYNVGIRYFINDDHSGKMTEDEFSEIERIYRTLPKLKK
ncbi:hypothetical protein [Flavobacterium lacisediminis]|uniref:DUF4136 domain-containing protein n=1 Tax=Flavobacterium lacisediminis TaxID=2989705 RepID=A0ABT3EI16_9FLAO|nr:hypothetical protein [Flavobacterium lacisediminis]MCW1148219.1 hypothetical protein [Flavobacterium lacisediminis]